MRPTENQVVAQSRAFAVRIVKLYQYLTAEFKEFTIGKQILGSGTSIGANIAESQYAESNLDFIHKMRVALKEANETIYWLGLLRDTYYITDSIYESMARDCNSIIAMLITIIRTASKNS